MANVNCCALANIVDGRCVNPDEPVKTLIVVPPHLVGHWYDLSVLFCFIKCILIIWTGSAKSSSIVRRTLLVTSLYTVLRAECVASTLFKVCRSSVSCKLSCGTLPRWSNSSGDQNYDIRRGQTLVSTVKPQGGGSRSKGDCWDVGRTLRQRDRAIASD